MKAITVGLEWTDIFLWGVIHTKALSNTQLASTDNSNDVVHTGTTAISQLQVSRSDKLCIS
jgi:hypothetical protein